MCNAFESINVLERKRMIFPKLEMSRIDDIVLRGNIEKSRRAKLRSAVVQLRASWENS